MRLLNIIIITVQQCTCAAWMLRKHSIVLNGIFYSKNYTTRNMFLFLSSKSCNHCTNVRVIRFCTTTTYHIVLVHLRDCFKVQFCHHISTMHTQKNYWNTYKAPRLKLGQICMEHITGIVAYADDIILISPTLSGLQHLLNKCINFYNNNAISLNIEKTEFITSGLRTPINTHIEMHFHQILPNDKLKHLGFIWSKKRNYGTLGGANVCERISKFWSVIHGLIKGGIRFCQPETIIELYKTLAVPTLTYGLEIPQNSEFQILFIKTNPT